MVSWFEKLSLIQWLETPAECVRIDFAYTGFFASIALILSILLFVQSTKRAQEVKRERSSQCQYLSAESADSPDLQAQ